MLFLTMVTPVFLNNCVAEGGFGPGTILRRIMYNRKSPNKKHLKHALFFYLLSRVLKVMTGHQKWNILTFPAIWFYSTHTPEHTMHNTQQDEPLPPYPQRLCPTSQWQHLPWPQVMALQLLTSLLQAPGNGFALATAGSLRWDAELKCIDK